MTGRPLIRREYRGKEQLLLLLSSFTKRAMGQGFPRFEEREAIDLLGEGLVLPYSFPPQIPKETLLGTLKESQLLGYGGAGYPVAEKLEELLSSLEGREGILIINAMECDPGLRHDAWLLREQADELSQIAGLLKESLPLREVYLAHSTEAPDFEEGLLQCVRLDGSYPAGEERALIKTLLGRELPEGVYPSQEGIWVQNLQTILELGRVLAGRARSRTVTLLDLDSKSSRVVSVPLGMRAAELIKQLEGPHRHFYIGSGLLEARDGDEEDRIDEKVGLLAIGKAAEFPDGRCRGCGQCSAGCPADIDLTRLARHRPSSQRLKEELKSCMDCRYCSYICPAGKDLHSLLHEAFTR